MFGMEILTDKKKQAELGEIAQRVLGTINETYRLAKENNEMLKDLTASVAWAKPKKKEA